MRRSVVYLALAVVLTWTAIDISLEVREFIWHNHGIEFYRARPELILVCAGLALTIGLFVMLAARRKRPRGGERERKSGDTGMKMGHH